MVSHLFSEIAIQTTDADTPRGSTVENRIHRARFRAANLASIPYPRKTVC